MVIEDKDFTAKFEDGAWHVAWKWVGDTAPPALRNDVAQYRMSDEVKSAFSEEVNEWIREGWLQRYEGEHDGIVPLMAVVQAAKGKVRPVLDFRELNDYVSSHTGTSVVCGEKIREWRKLGRNIKLLDLKKAYLQVRVDPSLWRYQVVSFEGTKYCLTRLGFGLNVAPKIMTAIVNKVLSMEADVRAGTDSYIDDIIVNENVVQADRVEALLRQFGLETKPSTSVANSRVLGLKIFEKSGRLWWRRDNGVDVEMEGMTKRDLFAMCGKMVGHFPVASWLRPACSYLKRLASKSGGWDEKVRDEVSELARNLAERVASEDPVTGVWEVADEAPARVWCDASSIAIGVCLEVGSEVVEDACWLRSENDSSHINLAELEAVLKGVNLAVSWGLRAFDVMTDSRTVFSWLGDVVSEERRIRTRGLGEALVRRRLGLLSDTIREYGLNVTPLFVCSEENKSDRLTRVPRQWMSASCFAATESGEAERCLKRVHEAIHCGIDKTLYLMRVCHPRISVTREDAKKVVDRCLRCRSIDPAPVRWEAGSLSVEENWVRIACDVTHYRGNLYLTLVDSGPSRFAVWKPILDESASSIQRAFLTLFREMGPPHEILLDNSQTFRSSALHELCDRWGVRMIYRAAYRPSGNAIVERNHRTIKRIAARTGGDVLDAVFWYNYLPCEGTDPTSAPCQRLFRQPWRNPLERPADSQQRRQPEFSAGDAVFVKPPGARCTTRWKEGHVTRVSPEGAVEVDGVHRHVGDIRRIFLDPPSSDDEEDEEDEDVSGEETDPGVRRSDRITAQPWRYCDEDYCCN